jgi:hypothetical protein
MAPRSSGMPRGFLRNESADGGRLRGPVGRHGDHGNRRQCRAPSLSDPEAPAVHDGHPEVEEDQIRRVRVAQLIEGFATVSRGQNLTPSTDRASRPSAAHRT